MSQPQPIKVALVDDDVLVVQLLKEFLEEWPSPSFKVELSSFGGQEFIQKLQQHSSSIDVLVLDLKMKEGDGFYVLEELKKMGSTIKVIVLTSYYKPAYIDQMMKLNVHAFLPKEIDKEDLIEVIQEVLQKGHYLSPQQIKSLKKQITPQSPKLKDLFTNREID